MKEEPEIVKELQEWEKNYSPRNHCRNHIYNQRPSKKLFEDAKKKQQFIPHITWVAIKAIFLGINLTLLIELYFIIFIENITTFDIIINISLTIIIFFIAAAYLLHHLEKTDNDIRDANGIIETLINNLEMRIEDRTAEVEKLLMQKDEFIASLGHDLKNPLGPLITLLPILEKTETDPKSKKMFEVLNRNVRYMKNLVVNTIELGKLNSPKANLDMEDANLLDEVNDVIKNNELLFEENIIEIDNKISDKTIIKADKMRLTELFDNLISNSVNYSPNGGTITIDVKEDKDFVTVSIKDTGIGMTEEQLSHIFDEFYKADEARHDFDSSGLGLTICKRIVERHGGKIWAESEGEEKGTTMFFTLPTFSEKADDGKAD
jgi:signal transduction histidine kinase